MFRRCTVTQPVFMCSQIPGIQNSELCLRPSLEQCLLTDQVNKSMTWYLIYQIKKVGLVIELTVVDCDSLPGNVFLTNGFLSGVSGRLYQEPEGRVDRDQRPAAAGQGAAGRPGATAAGDQPTAGVDSAAAAGDKQQPEPEASSGRSSGEGSRQPGLGRATGEVGEGIGAGVRVGVGLHIKNGFILPLFSRLVNV
jgi:hypothetical protein